jgi:hypothetical protein
MARRNKLVKRPPKSVRFTEEQEARLEQAAHRRAQKKGELVTPAEIIREGAMRLAEMILKDAA